MSDVQIFALIGVGGFILAVAVGVGVGHVIKNRAKPAPKPRRTPQAWPLKRKKK